MYTLPTSVIVNEKEYAIRNNGDFRSVLDCFEVLNDIELDENERCLVSLIVFYEEFSDIDDIIKVYSNKNTLNFN